MAYKKKSTGSKFLDWLFGYNVANYNIAKQQEQMGVSDEVMKEYVEDNSVTRGISNWWKKVTGNGLTDAEKEANEFSSSQADIAYQRQKEFYQEYQSPEAQMRSQMAGMQSVGVNPALMYGGSMPSGGSSSSPASPASVSPSSGESLGSFISVMLNAAKVGAEIRNINADTQLKTTGAKKNQSETEGIDIANYIADATKDLKIFAASLSNDKTAAEISNIFKGMELTDSQILVNGKQIDYLSSMVDLNSALADKTESEIALNAQRILESQQNIKLMISHIHLNNANASQIRALTPHLEALYESQANLYDAESLTELREAENLVARTAKTVVETAVSQKLIDSDYYDNVIKKAAYETSSAESQTHIDAVAAENAWNMLFAEFFQNMTDGIGNLLMPKAVSDASKRSADARAASGKGETTTTTIKEHRFDKNRDTRTTTRTIRR